MLGVTQVVKVRILAVDLEERRIKVSLRTSAADIAAAAAANKSPGKGAADPAATVLIGDVVEVEVTGKDEGGVLVKSCETGAFGFIPAAHLADYEALCSQLLEALSVPAAGKGGKGSKKGLKLEALVVEHERSKSRYLMSLKPSLVAAAKEEELPSSHSELRPQQFVQGFVKNVADFGCFVAFLNGLTALAPKNSLADVFVSSPADHYTVGQSVRCCVVSVDASTKRSIVTLKPSVCMCPDASLLRSLKGSEELLVRARAAGAQCDDVPAEPSLRPGSVVKAVAEEKKSYGMLFALSDGWTGFCPTALLAKDVQEGSKYKVAVLCVDRVRDMMTLTMQAETVAALEAFKGKTAAMAKAVTKVQTADSVSAMVQAVGEERVVMTLPDFGGVLAVASAVDFNLRGPSSTGRFKVGETLQAVVVDKDKADGSVLVTCGWELGKKQAKTSDKQTPEAKGAKNKETFDQIGGGMEAEDQVEVGASVKAVVTGVLPTFLAVRLGPKVAGRVSMTDMVDANAIGALKSSPLAGYNKGQVVEARVIGVSKRKEKGKEPERLVELSMRPEDLALKKNAVLPARPTLASLGEGQVVPGVIEEVRKDCLWVLLSSTLKGRVHMLDASAELDAVKNLRAHFKVGQGVTARILKADAENSRLDLSLRHATGSAAAPTPSKKAKLAKSKAPASDLQVGKVVPVRIIKPVAGMAYAVQLSANLVGRVHICDVSDTAEADPLAKYKAGDLVNGYIDSLETDNVFVSLRPSRTGANDKDAARKPAKKEGKASKDSLAASVALDASATFPEVRRLEDVSNGQLVSGYVKSTNAAGCFVQLGRTVTARVVISELSDQFIKDVKGTYPPGKLVTGRIIDIDTKKEQMSMSLKRSVVLAKKRVLFNDVDVGQIIRGSVKSVQSFGVFVRLRNSDLSGLCHISEVSDEFVKDLAKHYAVGDAVKAKVLRKDDTKKTISLGMKDAYFEGMEDEEDSDEDEEKSDEEGGDVAMRGPHGDDEDDAPDSEEDEEDEDDEEDEEDEEEDGDEDEDEEEEDEEEQEDAEPKMKVDKTKKKGAVRADDEDEDEEDSDEEMVDASIASKLAASKGTAFAWDNFGYSKAVAQDDSEDEDEDADEVRDLEMLEARVHGAVERVRASWQQGAPAHVRRAG